MFLGWLISCVDVPAQLVVVPAQVFVDVRGIFPDAMADGGKKWHKTTVMKVNKSKKSGGALTYDLKYEDGDREKHVKRSLIRVLHGAAAPGKLLVAGVWCVHVPIFSFLSFCTIFIFLFLFLLLFFTDSSMS